MAELMRLFTKVRVLCSSTIAREEITDPVAKSSVYNDLLIMSRPGTDVQSWNTCFNHDKPLIRHGLGSLASLDYTIESGSRRVNH
jgi:hypothetical protein